MSDEDLYSTWECECTSPTHGGKLWLCDTSLCYLNQTQRKEPMNETTSFTPVAEANAPAAAPLTDEQIAAILAASPGYITEPEVTEDEAVTVH